MKDLNELKLEIPNWNTLKIYRSEYAEQNSDSYDHYKIPEIEAKRFVARLVLIQIAEYLNHHDISNAGYIISVNYDVFTDEFNYIVSTGVVWKEQGQIFVREDDCKYSMNWLKTNHPEILEDYFR